MTEKEATTIIANQLNLSLDAAAKIIDKARQGHEFSNNLEEWLTQRFLSNCVFIDEVGYARMCINALKILNRAAATDYGSTRQRDLGQIWGDMTRGYLGEYAFTLFLKQRWGIEAELGHQAGQLETFLPTDIHRIREAKGQYRTPRLNLSVKTSKWNGIWLDIPGDQFSHADIHIFVKVGAGRDHLFAFFKEISVFKDKVLRRGETVGALTHEEADKIYADLPSFTPIPAYICGFIRRDMDYQPLAYQGKRGKKHYTIYGWNGPISPGDLERIKLNEQVSGDVHFEGIGQFSHNKGYLFNTGSLLWRTEDWQAIINQL